VSDRVAPRVILWRSPCSSYRSASKKLSEISRRSSQRRASALKSTARPSPAAARADPGASAAAGRFSARSRARGSCTGAVAPARVGAWSLRACLLPCAGASAADLHCLPLDGTSVLRKRSVTGFPVRQVEECPPRGFRPSPAQRPLAPIRPKKNWRRVFPSKLIENRQECRNQVFRPSAIWDELKPDTQQEPLH
jgi:hypothetical protein